MKETPRKLRARRDLHEGRGADYRLWWSRFDNANRADRRVMLRGRHNAESQ